jgi:acetyltransferase-like isoleucine patch superfamily enzyme
MDAVLTILGPDARADLGRYRFYDQQAGLRRSPLMTVFAHQGLQALLLYRWARVLQTGDRNLIKRMGLAGYPFASRINDIVNGVFVSQKAIIGPGCFIAHSGGVVIGAGATIGAHCNIANNVSIGFGSPVIGDRVLIGVGARVLGDIRIGSDVAIGANTVVTRDVPDRAIVVGAPGRIISYDGAFKHVLYPGAEADRDRLAALNRTDHTAENRAM